MALGTTNISTDLVGTTLGTSSRDVGTLCKHPSVNRFSRWKPYSIPNKLDGLTDGLIKSINFGMNPTTITIGQIPTSKSVENSSFIWGQWQAPTGGINSPFRLGDFRNYAHDAVDFFVSLELRNDIGGDKPISGNPSFPQFQSFYICRLNWNYDAQIKLNEYTANGVNFNNLHLTLVIGGNVGGLSATELMFAQSAITIGDAISNYSSELLVEMNTSGLADAILVNENIVLAFLAPKVTSPEQLASVLGVSLKLNSTITTTKYFESYAIFGDGGDGGSIPISTAEGYWSWMNSENPYIENGVNGYVMKFPMLNVTMTTLRSGYGVLRCYIQELNIDFIVTNQNSINFNTNGTQIIDTNLEIIDIGSAINPNTGLPYTSLSCRFYVNSITRAVASIFNGQNITITL